MGSVIESARTRYRRLMAAVQVLFTRHLEVSGWPRSDRLANADVFDRLVAPKLQERGRRVAYMLIDALCYEPGITAMGRPFVGNLLIRQVKSHEIQTHNPDLQRLRWGVH